MKACPNCKSEIEENYDICWNCDYSFQDQQVIQFEKSEAEKRMRKINCLRCETPMKKHGNFKFHEGSRIDLFLNRERFDLYTCPSCGKVEFFTPR